MNLSYFDLNLLRTLDILLREQNVTRAARRLGVTQQAASGALQRLRQHFDDELLTHVGRQLELTPLAKSLVVPVREALLAAQAALDTRPSFDPLESRATCRIAMSDYGILLLLPVLLRVLSVQAPHVRCVVEPISKYSFERLEMGDLDFCLCADDLRLYGVHRPGGLIRTETMFRDDFVCVVDPTKVDVSNGIPLEVYRQLRHNCVRFDEGILTIAEKAWAGSGHEFDVAVMAPSFSALIFMLPGTSLVATTQRRLANILAPRLNLFVAECPLDLEHLQEILMWHERNDGNLTNLFFRRAINAAVADIENLDRRRHGS